MPSRFRKIRFETYSGVHEYDNVLEYAIGRKYLFIRTEKETLSFGLGHIIRVFREYNGQWFQVNHNQKR